jgi:4-diphosphocytidyl-2-C-methyl-D-erythritol kinase
VLRWAGSDDPELAATLGADVPFCVHGGRARVSGIGEVVAPLPFESRAFVLLVPPFGIDTGSVYRAWDRLSRQVGTPWHEAPNDLTRAAVTVEPRLTVWRRALSGATGCEPVLAGSGSTWFVEGEPEAFGLRHGGTLHHGGETAVVLGTHTVPARWREDPED